MTNKNAYAQSGVDHSVRKNDFMGGLKRVMKLLNGLKTRGSYRACRCVGELLVALVVCLTFQNRC